MTVGGVLLRLATAATLAFIYIPLFIIGLYAFNENITQGWPISGYTTAWFGEAWRDENVRDALWLSVKCGLLATAIALLLGTAGIPRRQPATGSSDASRSRFSSFSRSRCRGS